MFFRRTESLEIFIEVYRAFPASFIGNEKIENTNSVILPPSALEKLSSLKKAFGSESSPVLFRILNIELNVYTHCGVYDFTAEEETCYLPTNLFNRLYLEPGMTVNLRNITLEKGKFIKIRPHQTEFIMKPNPRTILENEMRNYVCLTKGDTIGVRFNNKNYLIDIVECKPKDAISTTNVDIEVDFDKPLDYKEESETTFKKQSSVNLSDEKKLLTEDEIKHRLQDEKFKGHCFRIDGKELTTKILEKIESDKQKKVEEETYDPRKNRLGKGGKSNAFQGSGKLPK